jgi:hypothetical protein
MEKLTEVIYIYFFWSVVLWKTADNVDNGVGNKDMGCRTGAFASTGRVNQECR